jgi:hypothetical protein
MKTDWKALCAALIEEAPYESPTTCLARTAIREVAAWLISNPNHHFPPALVFALEQEAER